MIYSAQQYGEALYNALLNKKGSERTDVLKRFIVMLDKNHQQKSMRQILNHYEKTVLKKEGMKKLDIESVSPLSADVKKNIEKTIGGAVLISETINPELIAGMTLLLDDTHYIDASARTQLRNLF